jgi:pimeloyl-ACP methyl ester carboxylesterase
VSAWARLRRLVGAALAIIVFIVLAATTYQGVTTAVERRRFPRPGRMVNAGTHQLHIYCTGRGTPIVVLEAAGAGLSMSWGSVQPGIGTVTRTCSYDRSGLGWSEWGDPRFSVERVPEELHTLLEQAGEPPPYVLAGAGIGAAYAHLFAARFPADTAAVVLIDTASAPPVTQLSPWLARIGLLRLTHAFDRYASGLPAPAHGAVQAFLNRPDHLARAAQETLQSRRARTLAAAAPLDPRIQTFTVESPEQKPASFVAQPADARRAADAVLRAVAHARALR